MLGSYWNLQHNPQQKHKYFNTHDFDSRSQQVYMKHYHKIMRVYYTTLDFEKWEQLIERVGKDALYDFKKKKWR